MRKPVDIAQTPQRFSLRVRRVVAHGAGVYSLFLDPPPFVYQPGDCVSVFSSDGTCSRPYSFASAPQDPEMELLIRRIPGGRVSDRLCGLPPGAQVDISPPFGWFRPQLPPNAPKIAFATGTGIAPFLSARRSGAPPPQQLFWGLRDERDAVGRDLFPGLRLCISPRRITECLNDVLLRDDAHYHLCGLDRMIEEVAAFLQSRGISDERIHREVFFTGLTSASS